MGRPTRYAELVNQGPVNNAGAPTNIISWQDRLDRFLILGADGGTYYASASAHMKQGIAAVTDALAKGGVAAVAQIVNVMERGRLPKMETGIFALAVSINSKDPIVRAAALAAIPTVCKIPTHLFSLLTEVKALGGKIQGRAFCRALGRWYTSRDPKALAYHLIKYRSRNGWKHGDVLRLAHVKGYTSGAAGDAGKLGDLFAWETNKPIVGRGSHLEMIVGYLSLLQETATPADAVALIQKIRLPREAIPDRLLKSVEVWRALAVQSPMTALLRTLNRMTAVGVFDGPEGQSYEKKVTQALTNPAAIRGAKIHPINALSALRTYSSGKGVKGSLTWQPNREIVRALDQSFLASFEAQPSMGLRMMIGVDISGSMWGGQIAKIPGLVPGEAAWALAYQFYKTESSVKVMAFNSTPYDATAVVQEDGYLNVTKKAKQQSWDYGTTNCSALMQAATTQQAKVDVFVVITDNEHNQGPDPMAALAQYRKTSGINAKLIVIALTATEYSIGKTNDPGVLNIVGFDPVAPTIIRTFCQGTTLEQGAAGSEDSDTDNDNDNDNANDD